MFRQDTGDGRGRDLAQGEDEGDEAEDLGRPLGSGQIPGHSGDDRGDRPGGDPEAADRGVKEDHRHLLETGEQVG